MNIEGTRAEQNISTQSIGGRGIYTTTDGRKPMRIQCRFNPQVRETLSQCLGPWHRFEGPRNPGAFVPLAERLREPTAELSLLELRNCLEKVVDAYAHERAINTTQAVGVIGAIYGRMREALNELPEHPRLLPRREFIETQGALEDILTALQERESNLLFGGSRAAADLRAELEQYQGPSRARKMSWLSSAQLDFVHACLSETALSRGAQMKPLSSVGLLSEITEKLIDKLGMLHGDRLENIPGTRLFVPDERKAISRPAIEHALLTSTEKECRETLKLGALMVALGSGLVSPDEIKQLGFKVNCNTFIMLHDDQIKTGLRILKLIPGLIECDKDIRNVLQAYSREALVVEGFEPDGSILNLSRATYHLWNKLWLAKGQASPKDYVRCKIQLVQLIAATAGTMYVLDGELGTSAISPAELASFR
jgi:hypothetical protein